jgi:hypothetical protein
MATVRQVKYIEMLCRSVGLEFDKMKVLEMDSKRLRNYINSLETVSRLTR